METSNVLYVGSSVCYYALVYWCSYSSVPSLNNRGVLMYHIRIDSVPLSAYPPFKDMMVDAIEARDLAAIRKLSRYEVASLEEAHKSMDKFSKMFPDASVSIVDGLDPYLLFSPISGSA